MYLTIKEAFRAMEDFLEKYYLKTNSDNIGSFLGDLLCYETLTEDSYNTSDPAAWFDWMNAFKKVKNFAPQTGINLNMEEAFKVVIAFLENYSEETNHPNDVESLLADMKLIDKEQTTNPAMWFEWVDSVNKIKKIPYPKN